MYSSNDRYFAAKIAAERREMMMQRSMRYSRSDYNQVAVMPAPTFFDSLRASFLPLSLLSSVIISLIIVSIIILALVLIPLGL